jgi:hypothetical protein
LNRDHTLSGIFPELKYLSNSSNCFALVSIINLCGHSHHGHCVTPVHFPMSCMIGNHLCIDLLDRPSFVIERMEHLVFSTF